MNKQITQHLSVVLQVGVGHGVNFSPLYNTQVTASTFNIEQEGPVRVSCDKQHGTETATSTKNEMMMNDKKVL